MTNNSPTHSLADFDRWLTASWQTDQRYYQADISRDLFGVWLLKRCWGGLGSNRGNSKTHTFTKYEDALKFFGQVAKRRQQRGYIQVI